MTLALSIQKKVKCNNKNSRRHQMAKSAKILAPKGKNFFFLRQDNVQYLYFNSSNFGVRFPPKANKNSMIYV